jgi:hypothetical protein
MHIANLDPSSEKLYTPGTEIEFHIKAENPPKHFNDFNYIKSRLIPYDPFESSVCNAADFEIRIDIARNAHGPTPINLEIIEKSENKFIPLNPGVAANFHYSEKNKIGIANLKSIEDGAERQDIQGAENLYFRWFYAYTVAGTWLRFDAHVFGYEASEIMTMNRREFLDHKQNEINRKITETLIEHLNLHADEQDSYTDAFMELHDQTNDQRWKTLMLGQYQLNNIIDKERITIDTNTTTKDQLIQVTFAPEGSAATIKCWGNQLRGNRTLELLLKHLSKEGGTHGPKLSNFSVKDRKNLFYSYKMEFIKGANKEIDLDTYMKPLLKRHAEKSKANPSDYFFKRFLMPCPTKFQSLAVNTSEIGRGFSQIIFKENQNIFNALIFPFTLKEGTWIADDAEKIDRLIDHTFKYKELKGTTKAEIRATYEEYILRINEILPN